MAAAKSNWNWIWRGVVLSATAVSLLGAGAAGAESLYRWQTEDGVVSFSDDARRIPERYRATATEEPAQGLDDYGRHTTTDAAANAAHAERLAARLEGLRSRSGERFEEPAGAPALEGQPEVDVALQSVQRRTSSRVVRGADGRLRRIYSSRDRLSDQAVPRVQGDPNSDAPIVIEKMRVLDEDTGATRTVQVVRQGDKVLSITKPRSRSSSSTWISEQDLERR